MTKKGIILFGLGTLLILVAIAWFFTPISDQIMEMFGRPVSLAKRGVFPPIAGTPWEWLPVIFDGLHALFGAFGLYFMIKGARTRNAALPAKP